MKVVIAGSRALPKGQAPRLLIRFLASLPDDARVMLRCGKTTKPGMFEQDTMMLCDFLHIIWEWHLPEPTDKNPGRVSVFIRDIEMIDKADLVLLFITPEDAESGYSGTMHLMDKALDVGRPVYAYSVAEDGKVKLVGDYDPDHLYANLVPSP